MADLPVDAPVIVVAMQHYTRLPFSDDSPSEVELEIIYRSPQETLADTVSGLREVGRL